MAAAEDLRAPVGPVILEITGQIANTNGDGIARFDLSMLQALPQVHRTTTTPWNDQPIVFSGPLARDVLAEVGAGGEIAIWVALNDYAAPIPIAEFHQYDVILAVLRDGQTMPIRDKGPIFIIYPFDDHRELWTEAIYQHSIWQLKEIRVE